MAPAVRLSALAILAAAPCWIFLVHMALSRMLRGRSRQKVAALAAALGALPTGALLEVNARRAAGTLSGHLIDIAYAALVFGGLAYAYFHLFNLGETARRIRILREIYSVGALRTDDLADAYGRDELVTVRLARLVETGQVVVRDGRYVLAGGLLYAAARVVQSWRALLGFDPLREPDGRR